jgi:ClpP class serine protease
LSIVKAADAIAGYGPRGLHMTLLSLRRAYAFAVVPDLSSIIFLVPMISQRLLATRRYRAIRKLEQVRGSRVITLIHRQESISVLGIPLRRFIDVEDSEAILRAIRLTPDTVPIDLLAHTPGGLVLASEQIARALHRHPGKVTVLVPHYAMSGGTLLALAADEILMDENAVLGPVDPQIGQWPAASIIKVVDTKPLERVSDETLMLADLARKAQTQIKAFILSVLLDDFPADRANNLADKLSSGQWTHDFPLTIEMLTELGLPVKTQLPVEVYELMDLYPQAGRQRPSVQYVPIPYSYPATPMPAPAGKE